MAAPSIDKQGKGVLLTSTSQHISLYKAHLYASVLDKIAFKWTQAIYA